MKYLNALNKINGVGSQKMKLLIDFFGIAEKAWLASKEELIQSGIGESLSSKIISERQSIDPDQAWAELEKHGIKLLAITDEKYPTLLKEIPNPPYIIYVKGEYDFNALPMIAIVGSRKFTAYGKQVAQSFARDLAKAGITVVSGLAFGIDAIAHEGALDGRGQTVAVLGSSLEDSMIGPKPNFDLSRRVIENGCLVSEFPLGTQANVGTFPARNRIMAGMTLGTLVIEAAEGSGSLITANLALEFNREVFSVPGSIFSPASIGTNNLIKRGAKMVLGINDILEELHLEKIASEKEIKKIIPESDEEKIILEILSHEPVQVDRIVKLSKLETSVVSSCLLVMEMKGMIKNIGGQNYIIL